MRVPFGALNKDMPDLGNPGATVASGVFPRTNKSYGPVNGLSAVSDALDSRCQGAFASRDAAGNVKHFACDGDELYDLTGSNWGKVSKSGAYAMGEDETAEFVQYGQRVIVAMGHIDNMQTWALGSDSAFSDLDSAAPRARHIASVAPNFVMAGNTWDSVDGAVPNRVWWPAIDDPTDWPTPGTAEAEEKQSDYNDLPSGGWVQSIVGAVGGAAGAILCDTAIYRIEYAGPGTVFDFPRIEGARGTPAPNSAINVGPFAFYLGEDGFYVFDGSQSLPIGNQKIDKSFYADLNQSYFNRIYASVDPINKLVFWAYPSGSSVSPDNILIYNWELAQWSEAEIDCQLIYRALSTGYTLEELDAFGTLDSLPFSLDSRVWTGGRVVLAGFDTNNKQGYFDGANLAATMETTEFGRDDGQRVFVRGIRTVVDAPSANVSCALRWRDDQSGSLTTNTGAAAGVDGVCPQRQSARYVRARVSIDAGATWNHAQGIEPEMIPDGLR